MSLLEVFNNRYQLPNLVVPREEFVEELMGYLARMDDSKWMPTATWNSFLETASWGHNHNFGSRLAVAGRMEDRHIRIAERFMNQGVLPRDLGGWRALVVGCYTGGDALLLAAMGAKVDACEVHPLYCAIASFLSYSFGADVEVWNVPFQALDFVDYDLVYGAGVLYHLEDPLGGLRDALAKLKPGGLLLLETMLLEGHGPAPFVWYQGRQHPGYNWFVPSPPAAVRMMQDCGFTEVKHLLTENARGYFVACKPGEN